MLQRLRNRARGQEGFTLIELLVVILIIGILAAVAIPTFLSQTSKAQDSNVQAQINSAQTAMETYYTSNNAYPTTRVSGTASTNPLIAIEGTLSSAFGTDNMTVNPVNANEYTIVAEDPSDSIYFDLTYTRTTGAFIRTCQTTPTASQATTGATADDNKAGCSNTATW